MTFPQKRKFNFMKNLNPANMQFNNETRPTKIKNSNNKNYFRNINNGYININNPYNININKNINVRNSISMSKNNNKRQNEYSKKKMGQSQINFYNHNNNENFFPSINQRPNLNSISGNWMIYSHQQQQLYNDFINNLVRNNPQNFRNEQFIQIYDFEYKRPEEKLKKGQNQLILERLQKKYATQIREKSNNNFHRTGTGFYQKKNKIKIL
jgi:hypothetical protein